QPSPDLAELLGEVSTERLQAHVEALSLIDPAKGSVPGNLRTRYARRPETFVSTGYIADALSSSLGESMVHLDTFRINAVDSLMFNVVGELRGTDPDAGYYVICAHYDAIGTRSRREQLVLLGEDLTGGWDWRVHPSPGANDNASGIALVLEAARVLSARTFPWSVKFIAWSGEELGLWGSRHYANLAGQRGDRILGVLNFDMIGFNDLAQRLELVTNPASRWLVDHLRATNDRYQIGLQIDLLDDHPCPGLSDHAPFWARGYDAILGIENYLPTDSSHVAVVRGDYRVNSQYHSVADLPDSINWELVADVTRLTVAAMSQFGQEQGLPNLAVFTGDAQGVEDDLRIQVANLGVADVSQPFDIRVSRCDTDSTSCVIIHDMPVTSPLPAGGVLRIDVPWQRFGDTVLFIEVDPQDDIEEEGPAQDNSAFQRLRLVPSELVVYPNPFRAADGEAVRFSGLPFFSRVKILSLGGELVWEGREEDQGELSREIRWGATNANGFSVGSGVYIYIVSTFEGEMIERGKIAVTR
ncbi:MAG: M28 family metallopeptidase, partial [Candidatus Latescibacterota bacterium]|nr:M28 family metallopeptidase [Candidatus Latescibacterota bacterium]